MKKNATDFAKVVACDRAFVQSVSSRTIQSEFFYYEQSINGRVLVPNETLITDADSFFLGGKICNIREYEVFKNFVLYADSLANDEFSRVLDEYLGVIVSMLNPSFIAADIMVGEATNRLLEASNLIDALGDLKRLKADTQGIVSEGLA